MNDTLSNIMMAFGGTAAIAGWVGLLVFLGFQAWDWLTEDEPVKAWAYVVAFVFAGMLPFMLLTTVLDT